VLTIGGISGLRKLLGQELGTSDWLLVTQERIDDFARITDDHHWSHVDRDRAAKAFGSTIAHGALTLSLEQKFSREIYELVDIGYELDYGYRKVRFPAIVPVNSRIRMTSRLDEVTEVAGGVRCVLINTFELEGSARPACVAELILQIGEAG
jgi:acyl dehydratase